MFSDREEKKDDGGGKGQYLRFWKKRILGLQRVFFAGFLITKESLNLDATALKIFCGPQLTIYRPLVDHQPGTI